MKLRKFLELIAAICIMFVLSGCASNGSKYLFGEFEYQSGVMGNDYLLYQYGSDELKEAGETISALVKQVSPQTLVLKKNGKFEWTLKDTGKVKTGTYVLEVNSGPYFETCPFPEDAVEQGTITFTFDDAPTETRDWDYQYDVRTYDGKKYQELHLYPVGYDETGSVYKK